MLDLSLKSEKKQQWSCLAFWECPGLDAVQQKQWALESKRVRSSRCRCYCCLLPSTSLVRCADVWPLRCFNTMTVFWHPAGSEGMPFVKKNTKTIFTIPFVSCTGREIIRSIRRRDLLKSMYSFSRLSKLVLLSVLNVGRQRLYVDIFFKICFWTIHLSLIRFSTLSLYIILCST